MIRLKLILLLLASFNFYALAESCADVDLRPQMGPIQNQDDTPWCYSFPASDLVSFKLGRKVSPIDIAVQDHRESQKTWFKYNITTPEILKKEREKNIAGGGLIGTAIENAGKNGFCADEKIDINNMIDVDYGIKDAIFNLDQLNMKKFSYDTATKDDCEKFVQIRRLFPGITSFKEIERIANENTLVDVAGDFSDKACGDRIKPAEPFVVKTLKATYVRDKPLELISQDQFRQMDNAITSGKPVGIAVFMEKLKTFKEGETMHIKHALTIVGKSVNPATGKCEYILRNSWGPECDDVYKSGVTCEGGYLYVSEEILKDAVYMADYID